MEKVKITSKGEAAMNIIVTRLRNPILWVKFKLFNCPIHISDNEIAEELLLMFYGDVELDEEGLAILEQRKFIQKGE